MARGRKKREVVETVTKLTAGDLKKFLEEADRLKTHASDYSGMLGQATKQFVERTGMSRQASAFLLKLHRLGDPLKQQSLMDEIKLGYELAGFDDQGRLFDEHGEPEGGDEDDDRDVRPRFLQENSPADPDTAGATPLKQDGMPLAEAEKAFKRTSRKAPAPDALSALAGETLN